MADQDRPLPECFGELDTVFPMGEDGLRCSPEACMACIVKTACLKSALQGDLGAAAKEEMTDRAYASGRIGFFERWSRKKLLKGKTVKKEK